MDKSRKYIDRLIEARKQNLDEGLLLESRGFFGEAARCLETAHLMQSIIDDWEAEHSGS